jgi:hypothetical protein
VPATHDRHALSQPVVGIAFGRTRRSTTGWSVYDQRCGLRAIRQPTKTTQQTEETRGAIALAQRLTDIQLRSVERSKDN